MSQNQKRTALSDIYTQEDFQEMFNTTPSSSLYEDLWETSTAIFEREKAKVVLMYHDTERRIMAALRSEQNIISIKDARDELDHLVFNTKQKLRSLLREDSQRKTAILKYVHLRKENGVYI